MCGFCSVCGGAMCRVRRGPRYSVCVAAEDVQKRKCGRVLQEVDLSQSLSCVV